MICDRGEACGAWLTLDQPIDLDLQSDVTDIEFPIEYQVSISGNASETTGDGLDRSRPRPPYRLAPSDR